MAGTDPVSAMCGVLEERLERSGEVVGKQRARLPADLPADAAAALFDGLSAQAARLKGMHEGD